MNSPYDILGVSQDADNVMITRAVPLAMRARKYDVREIADARSQLSRPESRLAVDFLFPVFSPFSELHQISAQKKSGNQSIDQIDAEKYNSLK